MHINRQLKLYVLETEFELPSSSSCLTIIMLEARMVTQ